ncbi:cysteine desulfurase-like protein [Actinomycetospora lutea]|uniref:cysteine desulfurase-like protein n=1 Tax=Actinomycetospora lutea TaxID=663604 RepID=UPI002365F29A|nr:cysteine desulfurase-like protein [Actinomycetospora lutea]MDD7940927.1 cysteine desulfurase-like protein [Actinomycetospora lutea]
MAFDVARVRGLVPALGDGWAHLDGPTGMQVPEQVATAVSSALRAPVSRPGGVFPASQRGGAIIEAARRAVADLVGADPKGVVLGPGPAPLLERLADALSADWALGDEVVVSRLDDTANVAPWHRAAQRTGGRLRTAEIDVETCELPSWQFDELVGDRTRVVTVTAACPAIGTRTEVAAIARKVHALPQPGAGIEPLMVVDATAAAPFLPLDLDTMGADIMVLSAAAWGGPPVGALVFRNPELLDRLPAVSLDASAKGPERLEIGDAPYALLAGLVASIDYLGDLDDNADGPRRERVLTSMSSVRSHQDELTAYLVSELRYLPGVMVIGEPPRRIPVVAFTVAGRTAREVAERVAEHGVCVVTDTGDSGALEVLGGAEVGGVVRVGLAHYTTRAEIDTLVNALARL